MKIKNILCTQGLTGYFFDDKEAIKNGAKGDGEFYIGAPVTDGFTSIRMPGESLSIIIVLENGATAFGDCVAVQYSGAGGRDKVFIAANYVDTIEKVIKPNFVGIELDSFKKLAAKLEAIPGLHMAIRYGMSQALLSAVAVAQNKIGAQIVLDEYKLKLNPKLPRVFSQSGDNRYNNADKMIIKKAAAMPHALINTAEKLGKNGEKLREYTAWLKERCKMIGDKAYNPIFHFDVYGTIGKEFSDKTKNATDIYYTAKDKTNVNITKVLKYLSILQKEAHPHKVYIEGIIDLNNQIDTLECMALITKEIDKGGLTVKLVADEWCNTLEDIKLFADKKSCHMIQIKTPDLGGVQNTIEAVLYCNQKNIEAYLGGTCNETDVSARVCMQIAAATAPVQVLAKPGMGVDEGMFITVNELSRTIAILNASK